MSNRQCELLSSLLAKSECHLITWRGSKHPIDNVEFMDFPISKGGGKGTGKPSSLSAKIATKSTKKVPGNASLNKAVPEKEFITKKEELWTHKNDKKVLEGKFDKITGPLPIIVKIAMEGVSVDIFYSFSNIIGMPEKYLAEVINMSPRTLSNYKDQKKALEPVRGEHLLRIISLYTKGEEIFGNLTEFNNWLNKPIWNSNHRYVDWLVTPGGVDLVSQELDRLAEGYPV